MAVLKIKELVRDERIYPRNNVSWMTVYDYAESMSAGAVFPPIKVAVYRNRKFVVDGWHRVGAKEKLKQNYIDGEVLDMNFGGMEELYRKAVELNAAHGRPFSFQERLIIVGRLERMGVAMADISKTIGITIANIKKFKVERISYTFSGKEVVLKGPTKHLNGIRLDHEQIEANDSITGVRGQIQLIEMVIDMLDNQMFDMGNAEVLRKLRSLEKRLVKV